jgi:hypothetical protein
VRVVFDHIVITTNGASQASTAAEGAVLQRCGPVGTTPDGRPPEIPSSPTKNPINSERTHAIAGISRALVPVGRDPLEVEVDDGPQSISDPGPVVLFGFD